MVLYRFYESVNSIIRENEIGLPYRDLSWVTSTVRDAFVPIGTFRVSHRIVLCTGSA